VVVVVELVVVVDAVVVVGIGPGPQAAATNANAATPPARRIRCAVFEVDPTSAPLRPIAAKESVRPAR
jgi:hypothetical protein